MKMPYPIIVSSSRRKVTQGTFRQCLTGAMIGILLVIAGLLAHLYTHS